MDTTSLERLIDSHLAAYSEPDAARRIAEIRELWSPEGRLVDPPGGGEAVRAGAVADHGLDLLAAAGRRQ